MNPIKYFGIAGMVILTLLISVGCTPKSNLVDSSLGTVKNSGKIVSVNDTSSDWGDINIKGGVVSHVFTMKNDGDDDLILKGAFTSCMCTQTRFELSDGSVSPKYGMNNNTNTWAARIAPGETFDAEVWFDPLAHGPDATGVIRRSVNLITSDPNNPSFELTVNGNVLSKSDFKAKESVNDENEKEVFEMGDFSFYEKEFDFGVIKQSGGVMSHDFAFKYNGDAPIKITGTPGSCLCTTGTVSQKEFKKGDEGILTLEFDPNLHEEPEGRFFKSVAMLTDPKLEVIPEVKIWVEIDLDLGTEAYKLQGSDDEEEGHGDEVIEYNGKEIRLIEPEDLKAELGNKDFFLLDVHIPEQAHIPGTDAFVDYRELDLNLDKLPADKSAEIVVYCRSGSMSRSAAQDLVDMGYTNVYDLEGGINAFNAL